MLMEKSLINFINLIDNLSPIQNLQSIGFKSIRLGQGANTALPIFANLYQDMAEDSQYNFITQARFPTLSHQQQSALDCQDQKRDGFFKRLFSKDEMEREFEKKDEEEKEKKGFFNRLFGEKEH